jgi:putative membrane protein
MELHTFYNFLIENESIKKWKGEKEMMMGPGYGYFGGFGMGGGSLMMIIVSLAVGYLLYLAFNQNRRSEQTFPLQAVNNQAIDLAKGRLARGEITVEEFEKMKANLL